MRGLGQGLAAANLLQDLLQGSCCEEWRRGEGCRGAGCSEFAAREIAARNEAGRGGRRGASGLVAQVVDTVAAKAKKLLGMGAVSKEESLPGSRLLRIRSGSGGNQRNYLRD